MSGGASGIGAASVRALLAEGACVLATDRDAARGQALCRELARDHAGAVAFATHDVTQEADWLRVIGEAEARFGALHVLLNSAGVSVPAPIDAASFAHWREILSVNADGTFLGCRHGVDALRRHGGGAIVNVASVFGLRGSSAFPAYAASKAAVRLLTRCVALRCAEAGFGIRCNAILPGAIDTPMMDPFVAGAASRAEGLAPFARVHPLGRVGRPEEVAAMAVFLASEEAAFVTGAEFLVDGGFCA